jgi:hypothetical protein
MQLESDFIQRDPLIALQDFKNQSLIICHCRPSLLLEFAVFPAVSSSRLEIF